MTESQSILVPLVRMIAVGTGLGLGLAANFVAIALLLRLQKFRRLAFAFVPPVALMAILANVLALLTGNDRNFAIWCGIGIWFGLVFGSAVFAVTLRPVAATSGRYTVFTWTAIVLGVLFFVLVSSQPGSVAVLGRPANVQAPGLPGSR